MEERVDGLNNISKTSNKVDCSDNIPRSNQYDEEGGDEYASLIAAQKKLTEEHILRTLGLPSSFSPPPSVIVKEYYDTQASPKGKRKKKKNRNKKKNFIKNDYPLSRVNSSENEFDQKPSFDLDNRVLLKYYSQRYRLFSKYDEGIMMDEQSWYSVTPEKIAAHIGERCRCNVVLDPFCGVGGNIIQFAFTCERVIAIDIDPQTIEYARNNARIYGVEDRIEFIVGDFMKIYNTLKADVIFLSPPWGGPQYLQQKEFHLSDMPISGHDIFHACKSITPNIAYFLPRNTSQFDLALLADTEPYEIERNYLQGKLKTITTYFGELVNENEENSAESSQE